MTVRPQVGTTLGTGLSTPEPADPATTAPADGCDAVTALTGASPAVLAATCDCVLLGHPVVDGHECPCGQVVRTTTEPGRVMFHHEVSVWWAGVPRRQRRNRTKPERPRLAPRVQQVVYP